MIFTVVGATGSGKSLYQAYKVYTELTRIMNNGKTISRFKLFLGSLLGLPRWQYSYYDKVILNSDFDDRRGNFAKFDYSEQKWDYGGHVIGITDLPEIFGGKVKNCLIHLDEGGTQFATTDWDKMPEGYKLFLTTHRHNITGLPKRCDIFIYTQHKDLIEVTFRRIANRIYLIRPLFGFSKDPTRPSKLSLLPAIRMWLYWKHELLEGKQTVQLDIDGRPKPIKPEEELESLVSYSWYYIGRRYRDSYNTFGHVRELKRTKGV